VLHCKTVPGVLKELTVFAMVYNLVRMVMCHSAILQHIAWSGSASSMRCGGSAGLVTRMAIIIRR